jgi:hypothetical protein
MKQLLPLLLTFTLAGCASTVGAPERTAGLARFLAEPAPEILAYRRSLTVDQSLIAVGQERIAAQLAERFASDKEVHALLGHIQVAAPSLRPGVVKLVTLATPIDEGRTMGAPVLFIWPTWQVSYQRFPPRPDFLRLELGIIAKVIPRQQVMEGRGNLALRTAYWEARCHTYGLDGSFFSVSEWLEGGAARWKEALAEVRDVCSQEIGGAFEKSATVFKHVD